MISSIFKKSGVLSYLLSLALLAVAVYSQGETEGTLLLITFQKNITLFLLSICMLAVDWIVKQRYWATQANYHLLLFPFFILAFPGETWGNWLLVYFLFLWVTFNYIVAIDQSGQRIAKVFNAFFIFFVGVLFFPQGIIVLPFLWILLMTKNALNFQIFFISLLPIIALYLLEVILVYFLPNNFLLPIFDFSNMGWSFPFRESLRLNLWWGLMLGLSFFALLKHYIDMGTRSASYGSGMICLFIMTFMAIIFGVLFQGQSSFSWTLFLMTLTALSTRLFEGIKREWLREGIFFVIIVLLLIGKQGLSF
ncbi:MAG: hypothetical protein ACPGC8_07680 [Flavobacteriaceae bacterium]